MTTVQHVEAPATPLSLEAAQSSLILRHTHLSERLPIAKETAARATAELRSIREELEQISRTLKHVDRVRSPRRRRRASQ